MRKAGVVVGMVASMVALSSFAPPTVRAQDDDTDADRAAREIAAARERANEAAEALFAAQSDYEVLQDEQARLATELDALQLEVDLLREAVEAVAVSRFVASGSRGIPVLTDFRTPNDRVQADVLVDIVAESGATTLDDYEAARARLEDKQAELEDADDALLDTQARLADLQTAAEAEVIRLREVERQRLEDEAIRLALEARQREEQRQLEEFQRRQAEAQRRANPTPAASASAAAALTASGANTSGSTGASGGAAGGRTGGGGGGSNPAAFGQGYIDAIVCPVQGASAYGDSWGAPRSGGRRHQGVDMLAPTGTPLQAVVSGEVVQGGNRLGGITLTLLGDNGNRYYYAHLVGFEGLGGRVEQAQIVGYVGDSGNATGVPHLHFEIRPGGGVPVNPTASVRAAGC
jgi:murein DD-endopeptidase MepM/ murein hydrolase activator NlpD